MDVFAGIIAVIVLGAAVITGYYFVRKATNDTKDE